MSKKSWNPSAIETCRQINSTLNMLQEKALSIYYNPVNVVGQAQHACQITWNNHCPDRANAGRSFIKLEQYMHILQHNSYHCLLFDGSIIRANFEFEDNILVKQNLLWWPAPYDYGDLLEDGFPPVELMQYFYEERKWYEIVKMRSPIRIDFDRLKNTPNHPQSHLHMQNEDTRLFVRQPICFNRFIAFIFRNFYPEFTVPFSNVDFINYKVPPSEEIVYITSEIVV